VALSRANAAAALASSSGSSGSSSGSGGGGVCAESADVLWGDPIVESEDEATAFQVLGLR
jgi:hypothetical protein